MQIEIGKLNDNYFTYQLYKQQHIDINAGPHHSFVHFAWPPGLYIRETDFFMDNNLQDD